MAHFDFNKKVDIMGDLDVLLDIGLSKPETPTRCSEKSDSSESSDINIEFIKNNFKFPEPETVNNFYIKMHEKMKK